MVKNPLLKLPVEILTIFYLILRCFNNNLRYIIGRGIINLSKKLQIQSFYLKKKNTVLELSKYNDKFS